MHGLISELQNIIHDLFSFYVPTRSGENLVKDFQKYAPNY